MLILAIDTAANLCAASIWETGVGERSREVRDIGKGHAEQLIGVIDVALTKAGLAMGDLDAIAVSVGPGSFTGVRIGVAAARGLALALAIPAVGISVLNAMCEEAAAKWTGRDVCAIIEAGRGKVYAEGCRADGSHYLAAAELDFDAAVRHAVANSPVLIGSAARAVADASGMALDIAGHERTADIATFARLASSSDLSAVARPKPLYLRGADARPQTDFALPRKSDI